MIDGFGNIGRFCGIGVIDGFGNIGRFCGIGGIGGCGGVGNIGGFCVIGGVGGLKPTLQPTLQPAVFWIPACAGMTVVVKIRITAHIAIFTAGRECRPAIGKTNGRKTI
ncbi:hypothetical protein [Neisseria lactamica]|uniref:hypothetical protein n=1 Tax=Neisseria lactamica TaxID=486 RepID=UPI001863D306|nr:hypothetical protein [Neisseria lactamica]